MARNLTEEQREALDDLARATRVKKELRAQVQAEVEAEFERRSLEARAQQMALAKHCHALGISMRVIGLEGLGTSDYGTVKKMVGSSLKQTSAQPTVTVRVADETLTVIAEGWGPYDGTGHFEQQDGFWVVRDLDDPVSLAQEQGIWGDNADPIFSEAFTRALAGR